MSCDICSRVPSSRLPFYCPTCARSQLYERRIEIAAILLEKEAKGRQIERNSVAWRDSAEYLQDPAKITADAGGQGPRNWVVQAITRKQTESAARTQDLLGRIELLRARLQEKRDDVAQRKLDLTRRYGDAESAKYQITEREAAMLSGIQNSTKRREQQWNAFHALAMESRIYLCRKAAGLYGLRRLVEARGNESKETFVIGFFFFF